MRLAFALLAFVLLTSCGDGGDDEGSLPSATGAATTADTSPIAATPSPSAANAAVAKVQALPAPQELADGLFLGRADAKVLLAVYEDFQCPICLSFTAEFEALIIEDYVKPGKVRFEFRNFPILGNESALAAVAGVCAARQNRFWPYHRELFLVQAAAGQIEREQIDVGRFAPERLFEIARKLSLDESAFRTCFESPDALQEVVDDFREAQALGLRGTPSFILNGATLTGGPANAAGWRKLLDDAIEAAP